MKTMNILVDHQAQITTITINRPERRNALNQRTIAELTETFNSLSTDQNCRVIVLRGQGDESFCAGADLEELRQSKTREARIEFFSGLSSLIQTMHQAPQTIVASVHGFALAGGCGLVAACDIAIASDEAQFGLPELYIGLAPMVVMPALHRALGRRALADLVLSADRIDAARALQIGLITRICPKARLDSETAALTKRIAGLAPHAARAAKRTLYQVAESNYSKLLNELPEQIADLSLEREAQEGVDAFVAKRSPPWRSQEL
jgi:methylglutaconyl-CoA hydratase